MQRTNQIDDDDGQETGDEGLRGRLADSGSTWSACEALVAADDSDAQAEEDRLDQAVDRFPPADEVLGETPVVDRRHAVEADRDEEDESV